MRTETVSADSAKSKMIAGVTGEFRSIEAGRDSLPRRAIANDGSTPGGRSRIADSDVPMDYNMEQGGDSAEPQESTAELLDRPLLTAGLAELISPSHDPMDSRLEIIDFGRRLSKESLSGDESCAVPQDEVVGRSGTVNDEEPQWESAIVDSSDSPDDLDVLSIVDGSDVENGCDRGLTSDAELPNGYDAEDSASLNVDSVDTICPQQFADTAIPRNTIVVADEFLNVSIDDKVATEPVQSAEDEIDPGLRSFLKGLD